MSRSNQQPDTFTKSTKISASTNRPATPRRSRVKPMSLLVTIVLMVAVIGLSGALVIDRASSFARARIRTVRLPEGSIAAGLIATVRPGMLPPADDSMQTDAGDGNADGDAAAGAGADAGLEPDADETDEADSTEVESEAEAKDKPDSSLPKRSASDRQSQAPAAAANGITAGTQAGRSTSGKTVAQPTPRPTAQSSAQPTVKPTPMPAPVTAPVTTPVTAPVTAPATTPFPTPVPTSDVNGVVWHNGFADPRTIKPQTIANPDSLTVLVNKYHQLPDGYVPPLALAPHSAGQQIQPVAVAAWEALHAACLDETGVSLYLVSGFRSQATQYKSFTDAINEKGVAHAVAYYAYPRRSEHQLGLALDIGTDAKKYISQYFLNTPGGKWMKANGHRFGFILRYPFGMSNLTGYGYEAWHFRYVGIEAATAIHKRGITLEQY